MRLKKESIEIRIIEIDSLISESEEFIKKINNDDPFCHTDPVFLKGPEYKGFLERLPEIGYVYIYGKGIKQVVRRGESEYAFLEDGYNDVALQVCMIQDRDRFRFSMGTTMVDPDESNGVWKKLTVDDDVYDVSGQFYNKVFTNVVYDSLDHIKKDILEFYKRLYNDRINKREDDLFHIKMKIADVTHSISGVERKDNDGAVLSSEYLRLDREMKQCEVDLHNLYTNLNTITKHPEAMKMVYGTEC